MKYLSALILLLSLTTFSQAQYLFDDFEGNGNISTWFGDDCSIDTDFSNPFRESINASETVLKYEDSGGSFANVRFDITNNFDLSTQASFSLLIYIPSSGTSGNQPEQISLKLQDGDLTEPWSTQSEIIKPLVLDQWQRVSFNFSRDAFINLNGNSPPPSTRTDFDRVVLQINGENNSDRVVAYLDSIYFDSSRGDPLPGSPFDSLVWADEFEGEGQIDTSKWFQQNLLPLGNSWYNGEVQHYTDREENSFLDSGYLHIMAKKETFTDQGVTKEYTSARLNSKFAFTYGRVEARAKLPFGEGSWPAIWMLGKNIIEPGAYWTEEFGTVSWPACGEIDLMEHWGYNQNYVQAALHTPSSFGATVNKQGLLATDVSSTFHTYAMEWSPEKIDFFLDGALYYTYDPEVKDLDTWPFDADMYLLLNVAMVGNIDPTFTQSPMILDYIRVYQASSSPTSTIAEARDKPLLKAYPNPVSDRLKLMVTAANPRSVLRIYSSQGKLVESQILGPGKQEMDWAAYPKGIYILVWETSKGSQTQRIIKR